MKIFYPIIHAYEQDDKFKWFQLKRIMKDLRQQKVWKYVLFISFNMKWNGDGRLTITLQWFNDSVKFHRDYCNKHLVHIKGIFSGISLLMVAC